MGAMKHFLSYGRKFALASNILFGVLSLAMSIAGFVMRFGDQPVNEGTLQKIKDSARDAFGVYDLSTNNFRPITESLKQAIGTFLVVTGMVSAPLVVFGFYTFLRKKRNFLFAYVIIIGSLVAIQLFVNFHFLKNPETVQEMMKPYLREKINEYVGIHSSDQVSLGWNYVMQEGCSATLLGFYYTRHTGVIWSMIGVGLIDQIFLFVFAMILLRKTNCKVEPANNSTEEVCTTGDTQTTQMGLPSTASSAPVSLQPQQVVSSTAPSQHSFLPGYVPPTSTSTAAAIPPKQQQPVISSTTQNQQSCYPIYVPTTATLSAAALPPQQPVMQLTAPIQSNYYPMQPFLPGAVMPVHTSHDYARNTMPSTYIPMTTLPGNSMQALHQTQAPQAAQQQNYAPMTLPD